jgi:hypothetical protein
MITRQHFPLVHGLTGYWAITIGHALRAAWVQLKFASPRCCCSHYGETPTMYYGDEIGMQQAAVAPDQVRDPFEKNAPGIGVGRDGCRTPMQWTAETNAGFTSGQPWLPLAPDYVSDNVENLCADRQSILSLYHYADRSPTTDAAARGRLIRPRRRDRRSAGL